MLREMTRFTLDTLELETPACCPSGGFTLESYSPVGALPWNPRAGS